MGADEIAAIRPALRELCQAEREDPRRPEGGGWCAHFTVSRKKKLWVQVVSDCVNFYYPHPDDPTTRLEGLEAPLLPGMACADWEARKYATFGFETFDLDKLARLVDWLFVVLYETGAAYPLDVEMYRVA